MTVECKPEDWSEADRRRAVQAARDLATSLRARGHENDAWLVEQLVVLYLHEKKLRESR
jgi:hypothetical protein